MKIRHLFVFIATAVIGQNAFSCSCIGYGVNTIAYTNQFSLTKIKIEQPTLIERLSSLFSFNSDIRTYKVKITEQIKGRYPSSQIQIDTRYGGGSCGIGEIKDFNIESFVVTQNNGIEVNSIPQLSMCNGVGDEFAQRVKLAIANKPSYLKSVDTSKWLQINNNKSLTTYADIKNIRKDQYGSYVWILQNDKDSSVKSQKINVHIDCSAKKYSIDSEHHFSEFNANGEVLRTSNYGEADSYTWLELTPTYKKLLRYSC